MEGRRGGTVGSERKEVEEGEEVVEEEEEACLSVAHDKWRVFMGNNRSKTTHGGILFGRRELTNISPKSFN